MKVIFAGSIDVAHQPNEYLELKSLTRPHGLQTHYSLHDGARLMTDHLDVFSVMA